MSWCDHSIANLHHDNTPVYFLSPRTQTLYRNLKTGVLRGHTLFSYFRPKTHTPRKLATIDAPSKNKKNIRIFHLKTEIFHIVKMI